MVGVSGGEGGVGMLEGEVGREGQSLCSSKVGLLLA